MTKPEPSFGETYGFALCWQGLVSFAVFLPVFSAPFLPENASFGFVQIRQDSFSFVSPLFAWFQPSLIRNPGPGK